MLLQTVDKETVALIETPCDVVIKSVKNTENRITLEEAIAYLMKSRN